MAEKRNSDTGGHKAHWFATTAATPSGWQGAGGIRASNRVVRGRIFPCALHHRHRRQVDNIRFLVHHHRLSITSFIILFPCRHPLVFANYVGLIDTVIGNTPMFLLIRSRSWSCVGINWAGRRQLDIHICYQMWRFFDSWCLRAFQTDRTVEENQTNLMRTSDWLAFSIHPLKSWPNIWDAASAGRRKSVLWVSWSIFLLVLFFSSSRRYYRNR